MTYREALEELGIDRDASAAEARRAYLKLLKTRRPETDPQGFMRLREAFDLLKGILAAQDTVRRAREAEVEGAPPAVAEPPPAPAVAEPPAPEPAVQEDVAPEPAAHDEPAQTSEAEAAQEDAGEEEGEEQDEQEDEPPSEAEADRLLAEGDRAGAAAELARLFDAAAAEVGGAPPPFAKAMRLVLALHEHGELGEAVALQASMVAWLHASGQEVRVLRDNNAAAAWGMTRELGALKGRFPKKVRKVIARGLRTGDVRRAQRDLEALRYDDRQLAEDAAGRLRVSAPLLAQQFAGTLDPPQAPPAPARGRGQVGIWVIAVALINLARFLFSSSPSYTPPPPRGIDYGTSARAALVAMRARAVSARATRLASQAEGAAEAAVYEEMASRATALGDHARLGCSGAWDEMRAIPRPRAIDAETQRGLDALDRSLRDACGDPMPAVPEPPAASAAASASAGSEDAGPKARKRSPGARDGGAGKGAAKKP